MCSAIGKVQIIRSWRSAIGCFARCTLCHFAVWCLLIDLLLFWFDDVSLCPVLWSGELGRCPTYWAESRTQSTFLFSDIRMRQMIRMMGIRRGLFTWIQCLRLYYLTWFVGTVSNFKTYNFYIVFSAALTINSWFVFCCASKFFPKSCRFSNQKGGVRSKIAKGGLLPKHGQTIRTGSIKKFVCIEQIRAWNSNSLMKLLRIVCPCFGGRPPVVIYDLTVL